jgi:alkaline phosphatase D
VKRRDFLHVVAGAGAIAAGTRACSGAAASAETAHAGAPALITSDRLRPAAPGGVQVGDVTADRALVWSCTDRPARLVVEYGRDEALTAAETALGPAALEDSGFTARVDLGGLRPGEMVFYRVRFESLEHPGTFSEPMTGRFRTAPVGRRDLTIAWSADTVGQGWGLNPDFGGLRLYETMLRQAPDVFVHSGDMIYADNPLRAEVPLADGTIWRNLVTPAKSKVAETLEEFRGNYAYNLLDSHMRRFNAAVPIVAQWDDHEVLNNWHPGMPLEGDARYTEKSIALLAARARRAMFDFVPVRPHPDERERVYRSFSYGPALDLFVLDERSYRGPNTANRQPEVSEVTAMLGRRQLDWLKASLRTSRATWKVIASDMPVGLMVRDSDRGGQPAFEAFGNGEGPPLGRELELAELLSFIKAEGIRNTLWITADVHYAAAHHYAPERAAFADFLPFWEFVAGPLHAGSFGPVPLDPTFGPAVRFESATPGMRQNRPPSDGHQYFGTLRVDGSTSRLSASLFNLAGDRVFSVDLEP